VRCHIDQAVVRLDAPYSRDGLSKVGHSGFTAGQACCGTKNAGETGKENGWGESGIVEMTEIKTKWRDMAEEGAFTRSGQRVFQTREMGRGKVDFMCALVQGQRAATTRKKGIQKSAREGGGGNT